MINVRAELPPTQKPTGWLVLVRTASLGGWQLQGQGLLICSWMIPCCTWPRSQSFNQSSSHHHPHPCFHPHTDHHSHTPLSAPPTPPQPLQATALRLPNTSLRGTYQPCLNTSLFNTSLMTPCLVQLRLITIQNLQLTRLILPPTIHHRQRTILQEQCTHQHIPV